MIIELRKFGKILNSRGSGREARAAFLPSLRDFGLDEKIEIDFQGVTVLTPSWADEFITPLEKDYKGRISFVNDDNPSVKATFKLLHPNLDLNKIAIFEDKLVFDENVSDDKLYNSDKTFFVQTFPYQDDEALHMLLDNNVKMVMLCPVDSLSSSRLNQVIEMLNKYKIETKISKGGR